MPKISSVPSIPLHKKPPPTSNPCIRLMNKSHACHQSLCVNYTLLSQRFIGIEGNNQALTLSPIIVSLRVCGGGYVISLCFLFFVPLLWRLQRTVNSDLQTHSALKEICRMPHPVSDLACTVIICIYFSNEWNQHSSKVGSFNFLAVCSSNMDFVSVSNPIQILYLDHLHGCVRDALIQFLWVDFI